MAKGLIMLYKSKIKTVEAIRVFKDNLPIIESLLISDYVYDIFTSNINSENIKIVSGDMCVNTGDYIVKNGDDILYCSELEFNNLFTEAK